MNTRMTMAGLGLALIAGVAAAQAPGAPAPAFTRNHPPGKAGARADYKGKYLGLVWANPDSPVVQKH